MRLEDGRVHIDGYPDAKQLVSIATPLARRLLYLRLHEQSLLFCRRAMQDFTPYRVRGSHIGEAILTGIVVRYFACFGENRAASPLSPDRVFAEMPDAKKCFIHWRHLRNKHFVHEESDLTFHKTALVLGQEGEVQDVISLIVGPQFAHDDAHCNLLSDLIAHTLEHVSGEISALLPKLFAEAEAMSSAEREALPAISQTVPDFDQVAVTRAR